MKHFLRLSLFFILGSITLSCISEFHDKPIIFDELDRRGEFFINFVRKRTGWAEEWQAMQKIGTPMPNMNVLCMGGGYQLYFMVPLVRDSHITGITLWPFTPTDDDSAPTRLDTPLILDKEGVLLDHAAWTFINADSLADWTSTGIEFDIPLGTTPPPSRVAMGTRNLEFGDYSFIVDYQIRYCYNEYDPNIVVYYMSLDDRKDVFEEAIYHSRSKQFLGCYEITLNSFLADSYYPSEIAAYAVQSTLDKAQNIFSMLHWDIRYFTRAWCTDPDQGGGGSSPYPPGEDDPGGGNWGGGGGNNDPPPPQPSQNIYTTEQITAAAQNAVQWIISKYGRTDPYCNFGVNHLFLNLANSPELTGLKANEMIKKMTDSDNWMQITLSEAQEYANNGRIVIAGWINPSGASGHVVVIVPGEEVNGWPVCMDTGKNKRAESQPSRQSFGSEKRPNVKFFLYK